MRYLSFSVDLVAQTCFKTCFCVFTHTYLCAYIHFCFTVFVVARCYFLVSVCGLCIPVIEESLDDRMSKALLKYAICSLDLVEENIFLWQITGLNEVQILSMILQFSQYLRSVFCVCIYACVFYFTSFCATFVSPI